MGDDKPFECTVTGCGMKFTNEDHLTVHKTKHQLTLTLVPNEFKGGQTPGFVDQTPTPSKFLKNFEEVTLFHDFSKNPFEEAFKKATEQPSPCADLDSSRSPSAYDTLNTPNPGFLVAIVDNKHSDHDSSTQGHQQSTFTSSEHSFFLLPPPSCSTSELTNQNSDWSSMDVDHDGNHHQQHVEVTVCNPINNVENVLYVGNSSLQHGTVDLNSVPANTGCITYLLANDTLVPISLPSITKDNAPLGHEKSDDKQNMQGNRVRQKPLHMKSVVPNSHEVVKGKRLIKIQPSPSSHILAGKTTLGAPNKCLSAKNGIARSTKEKLKATIQQNVQQQQQQQQASNTNNILDGVDFVPQKQHVSSSSSSSVPSSSSSTWNMSYVVSNAEAKEIEECEDVVGSLLTGKKICLVPVEEERDDKRRKFLERNRAAAARCRQKKKVWMNTMALKSEQLEAVNKSMQNELKHLRKEVQLLRSLLETHKECPVTLKQRALKEEMQSNHVTSSSSATANGVGVIITTSDEELAMNALSNMASYAG